MGKGDLILHVRRLLGVMAENGGASTVFSFTLCDLENNIIIKRHDTHL